MSKDNLWKFLLAARLLGAFDSKEKSAQELYNEWYSPDEIADELDMDEDDIRDIVWDEDYDDYRDYDY